MVDIKERKEKGWFDMAENSWETDILRMDLRPSGDINQKPLR